MFRGSSDDRDSLFLLLLRNRGRENRDRRRGLRHELLKLVRNGSKNGRINFWRGDVWPLLSFVLLFGLLLLQRTTLGEPFQRIHDGAVVIIFRCRRRHHFRSKRCCRGRTRRHIQTLMFVSLAIRLQHGIVRRVHLQSVQALKLFSRR